VGRLIDLRNGQCPSIVHCKASGKNLQCYSSLTEKLGSTEHGRSDGGPGMSLCHLVPGSENVDFHESEECFEPLHGSAANGNGAFAGPQTSTPLN
jgi:hypothetical protein